MKPFELTQNLSERLKLTLRVQETSSPRRAWDQVSDLISEGIPVGLQLDSHELDYFSSRIHFAGHIVALYGYDDQNAYLVDTAQQGGAVTTSLESLARARAARGPMSARHRSFSITASQSPSALNPAPLDPVSAIIPAILLCAEKFLNPPMKNVGHQGIRTAAKRMQSWFERIENPEQGLALIATLMERAGTGGALFRNLYRGFLAESLVFFAGTPAAETLEQARHLFAESARRWTHTAQQLEKAGSTGELDDLTEAAGELESIATLEARTMTQLHSLKNT